MTCGSVSGVLVGGWISKSVVFLKYWMSVPSKQSKTTNLVLLISGHLRVPRPSICTQRMRDLTGRRKTMNSSAGMSTPVESMSTVTTTLGFGRLRNSRMRWSGRSTFGLPVIFWTKSSPWPNTSRQVFTSWSACEVWAMSLTAKMRILGKWPVSFSWA